MNALPKRLLSIGVPKPTGAPFCLRYRHLMARTFLYRLPQHRPKLYRAGSPMIVALCALAVSQVNTAGAQKREPDETEKALAAQIKCEDFSKRKRAAEAVHRT